MSTFILKLIDESILPAVLVFSGKIASLILIARYLGVSFTVQNNGLYFSKYSDLVLANDISNIFVGLIIVAGASTVLVRLYYFHASHVHPFFLTKLLESDLEFAISTSFNLFHQVLVWLTLGFAAVASFLIQAVFALTSPFIFLFGLFIMIFLSALAVIDFEREVKIENKGKPSFFISKI